MTRRVLVERLEQAFEDLPAIDLPMVIVGSAVMPVYADTEAATILRETVDVDIMVEAATVRACGRRADPAAERGAG